MAKLKLVSRPRPGVINVTGIELDYGALKTAGPRYWALVALLFTVVVVGVTAWGNALAHGGSVMAMRDNYPWGLWFTDYMYYVGLSAGGLVVYASVHLFGAEQFRPLSRLAVLQAGILVMMALLSIVTDMERPWRAVWMLITPNKSSPFVYTGSAANIYMIICFVDLWILITGKGGEKLAHRMTLIALPFAIYLHTTTAWVLALNKSRELWNSAVMVPIFLTSATASGVALLLLVAYAMKKARLLDLGPKMFRSMATLLASVIAADLFLLFVEILTTFWPTSAKPGHAARLSLFFSSPYAVAFIPVLILGVGAFSLLAGRKTRHLPRVQIAAAAMYVVAVFLKRYSLMAMGFAINPLGQYTAPYLPSLTEVLIAGGLLGLGALFMTLGAKALPLRVPEEHGHGEADETEKAGLPEPASPEIAPEPVPDAG